MAFQLTKLKVGDPVYSSGGYAFKRFVTEEFSTAGLEYIPCDDGSGTYYACKIGTAKDKDIVIASSINGIPVTRIDDYAFEDHELNSVTIPNGVTSIGYCAFSGCFLKSIKIPNSVTNIDHGAFQYCNFTSITLPNGITDIGAETFHYCDKLTSIAIPNGVETIGESAFMYCTALTSITIPNSVENIGDGAFYGCGHLETVYFRGTEEQWSNIRKGSNNEKLLNATIICEQGSEDNNSLSGQWLFNDGGINVAYGNAYEYRHGFTSNGQGFTGMIANCEIEADPQGGGETIYYIEIKYGDTTVYTSSGGWVSEGYKTVDFGSSPQTADFYFINWFVTVASKVVSPSNT